MPVQTINHTPVRTRGCTQNNPDSDKAESEIPDTSKGWTSGLPFFNVSRWSFWGNNPEEPDNPEARPDQEMTPDEGTLNPASQEYPAMMLRQSEKDEEPVKNKLISAPIEAFGAILNMFLRPPSPSTVTSAYEDTFEVNQGDDLDPETEEDLNNATKGMTDEQYATYQHRFQSVNKLSNDVEPGPSDKVKGKQAQWKDWQILAFHMRNWI